MADTAPEPQKHPEFALEEEESAGEEERVEPEDVPYGKCRWDFFLSHKQSNAQDAVQNLRLALSERFLGASFWLDIEQDPTVRGMCNGVSYSRNVLIFLTEGITESKFCQMELRWALEANRNLILVMETDDRHGKPNMEQLINRCPDDLKAVFTQNEIIPWFRDPEFRSVSVEKILRKCAPDPRREASFRKAAKPLVYASKGEGDDGAEVFDKSFVIFTAMCGVALPGAGKKTKCWAVAVRIILLTCGMMCCSRLFTPEGPAFLDYLTIVQIVAAHPMIFLLLHVMLVLLRSDIVADLLENQIDCASEGKKLRFKTKLLTCLVALLTTSLSLWGWVGYLPGFFHPYYLTSGNALVLYGIAHGLTWILILPIFFGSFFAALMIMFTLQELCNMALLTAFNELNHEFELGGLEGVVKSHDGLNVTEHDLFRFQVKYAKSYELYKKIQWQVAMPLAVFWFIEFGLVIWSIWSLAQGFAADVTDWRVPHLKSYWNLVVRLSWFVGGSPWFGAGCDLAKFLAAESARHALRSFLGEFALEFRVSFIQATPKGLLLFVPVLVMNTLGFIADALRLFNSI
eukprot:s2477_g17.t1